MDLPDKVYFRIGEVAEVLAVQPHVVRFWQQQFPTVRPERSRTGRFLYTRKTVEQLAFIQVLLKEEGYTIVGAKKALRERGRAARKNKADRRAQQESPTVDDAVPKAQADGGNGASEQRLAELSSALETAQSERETAQIDRETAQSERETAQIDRETAQSERETAQSERDSLKAELSALRATVARETDAALALLMRAAG